MLWNIDMSNEYAHRTLNVIAKLCSERVHLRRLKIRRLSRNNIFTHINESQFGANVWYTMQCIDAPLSERFSP